VFNAGEGLFWGKGERDGLRKAVGGRVKYLYQKYSMNLFEK
jgi:hypothetical protein